MLGRFAPLWIATHFNHVMELTPEAAAACERLTKAGIPILNQTVLLRGVNDSPANIAKLCRGLVEMRVKPYYVFVADPAEGAMHFRTSIDTARSIMAELRGRLSGLAMPTLAADLPDGGGKVVLEHCSERRREDGSREFRGFDGRWIVYPDAAAD
jgi:lysine 2,3-aminomutase